MPKPTNTPEKISMKLKHFANHQKLGVDKVSNFWLKQLTVLHWHYSNCFNRLLKEKRDCTILANGRGHKPYP